MAAETYTVVRRLGPVCTLKTNSNKTVTMDLKDYSNYTAVKAGDNLVVYKGPFGFIDNIHFLDKSQPKSDWCELVKRLFK